MTRDMTSGNITRHLLTYAVPLMFANLLQQFYQTVDSIVVGRFNGRDALASIGAAGPIMNILIFLFVGLSLGASILMAEYFGAQDYKALKTEMGTSLVSGIILTVLLSIMAIFASGFFIKVTNTPAEIAPMATQYLRIISMGLIFTFFYNILSAGLRAIGDSRAPLYVLCFTTVIHVILALYFVGKLGMGVQGAAYATIISQAVSALILFIYINYKVPYLRLTRTELHINTGFLKKTINFSSISALQQTVLYIGRLLVQSGINLLGVDAVAAFNAGSIIDSYVLAPGDSLGASLTTFTAQNRGGRQHSRIPKGLKTVIISAEVYTVCITILVLLGKNLLLGIFLKPDELVALHLGTLYVVPMSCFYFLSGLTYCIQGYFRGIGKLKITLFATVLQIPIRVIFTYLLLGRFGIQSVVIGTAVGWFCMCIYGYIMYQKFGRLTEAKA